MIKHIDTEKKRFILKREDHSDKEWLSVCYANLRTGINFITTNNVEWILLSLSNRFSKYPNTQYDMKSVEKGNICSGYADLSQLVAVIYIPFSLEGWKVFKFGDYEPKIQEEYEFLTEKYAFIGTYLGEGVADLSITKYDHEVYLDEGVLCRPVTTYKVI